MASPSLTDLTSHPWLWRTYQAAKDERRRREVAQAEVTMISVPLGTYGLREGQTHDVTNPRGHFRFVAVPVDEVRKRKPRIRRPDKEPEAQA